MNSRAGTDQVAGGIAALVVSGSHRRAAGSARHKLAPLASVMPAVFHRRAVQQHVGVDGVIVIALWQPGIADTHFHRRTFAGEIRGIRHGAALLQEKLAVRDVTDPRLALVPPRFRALEVKTPTAPWSCQASGGPRLHGVAVEKHSGSNPGNTSGRRAS